MTDPLYSGFDTNFTLKTEPSQDTIMGTQNPSASVPIPARRINELSDFTGLDQYSVSPYNNLVPDPANALDSSLYSGNNSQLWDPSITNSGFLDVTKMDDDDIFQDTTNPLQDLTLAELNGLNNSGSDPLDCLNFDDIILPDAPCFNNYMEPLNRQQNSPLSQPLTSISITNTNVASSFPPDSNVLYRESHIASTSMPSSPLNPVLVGTTDKQYQTALSPVSHSSSSSLLTPPLQKPSTLHDLLLKKNSSLSPEAQHPLGQSVPGSGSHLSHYTSIGIPAPRFGSNNISRLSSSAPTHMDHALRHEQIWQRRESRNHLLSTSSLAEGGSTSSLSTGGILSPDPTEFSFDDSDDDSYDHEEDYSSDADSGASDNEGATPGQKKKDKAFWQYNVQSKGPKGQRLVLNTKPEDPHFLNEITDPVFSPQCAVQGIKHSGKARKGDGNDLTPNPTKLHVIGKELDKLSHIIQEIAPVNELPYNARSTTRREKNKLASRACRLKKKAQHEANKIKLVGLENEHKRLLNGIAQLKQNLYSAFAQESNGGTVDQQELVKTADKIVKQATRLKIAGQTTDYVNKVLEGERGYRMTGLDDL